MQYCIILGTTRMMIHVILNRIWYNTNGNLCNISIFHAILYYKKTFFIECHKLVKIKSRLVSFKITKRIYGLSEI